ncbi:MAG: ribosome biogenesis GTP-binding protein YihA/YsxC [Eubacteriales bacterium]
MKIHKAEYVISAVHPPQYPEGIRPEIAISGRSNVGKSSLINKLLNRKNLARVGQTPGKTQTINFYDINDEWYLVDLPGYGYAKVSLSQKAQWGKMMETYFRERVSLLGVVMIVDIRHKPTADDSHMLSMLNKIGIPALVVATKADKIARGQRARYLQVIAQSLNIGDYRLIIPFSAKDGTGLEELHSAVEQVVVKNEEDSSTEEKKES